MANFDTVTKVIINDISPDASTVSGSLAKEINDYFETINKIMVKPENARPIVIALANVIFKTDLKGWLGLRCIPKDEFKFTLITGKGEFKNGRISVSKGDELQEYFTTTMIMDAISDAKGRKYFKVTPQDPQGRTGRQAYINPKNPSKLFYKLWLGTLNFADIEIISNGKIQAVNKVPAIS